ncbi:hypothetical protein K402DRAFT_61798 [Aulographum hederae CBS 113979]|uniref:Uncharacterized protein n=1 Tax=Aulographum hederae CBS 113979 TaxID=1176131 RepID=A0A6G1H244_9PEZI|nr:hypothetical protein K402DRAFT_61798 [Aulographum hederae CBS 113979]
MQKTICRPINVSYIADLRAFTFCRILRIFKQTKKCTSNCAHPFSHLVSDSYELGSHAGRTLAAKKCIAYHPTGPGSTPSGCFRFFGKNIPMNPKRYKNGKFVKRRISIQAQLRKTSVYLGGYVGYFGYLSRPKNAQVIVRTLFRIWSPTHSDLSLDISRCKFRGIYSLEILCGSIKVNIF